MKELAIEMMENDDTEKGLKLWTKALELEAKNEV